MKGLKDPDKLSDQQMRISVALQAYTSSHYKQAPNKFGELLLRLSELSRISFVLKGHLLSWMPPDSHVVWVIVRTVERGKHEGFVVKDRKIQLGQGPRL